MAVSKAVRIRRMLSKGATVSQVAKALGCSTNYVYIVRNTMRKEAKQQIVDHVKEIQKTGINETPTLWQRFKAAIGF